jgi:amino acid adenylation domain-containing protein
MQGAWAVLLARHSGEREVVYGVTVSGRPAELVGVERMVGLLINTLPLRVRVDGGTEVAEWLRRLQAEQVELRQYEYSPLVEVAGWSEVERGVGLFESLLVFENYPVEEELRQGASERRAGLEIGAARAVERTNYPLTVVCGPGERLSVRISYAAGRYEGAAVERMLGQLERIVEGMVGDAGVRVQELELVSGEEREQLLGGWNETGAAYGVERTLAELFEEQVERAGAAVALESETEELSYAELNERANQVGHYLREQGVGPEVLVGLLMERGIELVVGLLGVLKAGGAYVPLDPAYPQERLSFMMADAGVKVLLTQQKLVAHLPVQEVKLVCIDSDSESIAAQSKHNFQSGAGPLNAAYVIYTSGSTGKPKGTLLEHKGVCNLVEVQRRYLSAGPGEKVLLFASISFDASVFDTIQAVLSGGTLYVPSQDTLLVGESLGDLLREKRITATTLPPSVLATVSSRELPHLKTLIAAGEACSADLAKKWSEGRNFINGYGPTEATVCATLGTCVDGSHKPDIGRPVNNKKIYILDERHQPVPVCMTGEMHIGGVGLARCYLNRPDLTAEKFIPDPFSAEPGRRMYQTGDLGRYLSDGRIDYEGRIDHQVKIRGYRIELNEIEEVLMQHPRVRDAVVLAHSERTGVTRLVGYVVSEDQLLTGDILRSYVREQLPGFMVPSALVFLDEMPLSPNGKVDQRVLPLPDWTSMTAERVYVAPRTPEEEQLAQIWSEVLGVTQVSMTDNFFEIGGHSLLATQVVSRVREAFETELPLTKLFENPTVETLAAALAEHLAGPGEGSSSGSQKITHENQSLEQQLADLDQLSEDEVKALVEMELQLIGDV